MLTTQTLTAVLLSCSVVNVVEHFCRFCATLFLDGCKRKGTTSGRAEIRTHKAASEGEGGGGVLVF